MNMTQSRKLLSLILCIVLIAATALFAAGCGASQTTTTVVVTESPVSAEEAPAEPTEAPEPTAVPAEETSVPEEVADGEPLTDVYTGDTELGEGSKTFTLVVTGKDGNVVNFTVHTDADTVGDALLAVNLIAGEESSFGLYVKVVNGITADYDVDQSYWAFYIDGEYAMTGVDATEVSDGATYGFTVE